MLDRVQDSIGGHIRNMNLVQKPAVLLERIQASISMLGIIGFIRLRLGTLLILLAPFSFFPYIAATPMDGFIALRVGVYQLAVIVFVIVSLKYVWSDRKSLYLSNRLSLFSIVGLFLLSGLTYMSAINKSRSAALVGSVYLLLLAVLSMWQLSMKYRSRLLPTQKAITAFAVFYLLISLFQLADATLSKDALLLCGGCSSSVFGFARVNGFAAEPQFWANALLPFFVLSMVGYYTSRSRASALGLFSSILAITLTFSRGAFVAVFAAVSLYFGYLVVQNSFSLRKATRTSSLILLALLVGFVMLLGASVKKYKNTDYIAYNTFRGMIEQLSLGEISLPKKTKANDAPRDILILPSANSTTRTNTDSPTNQGVVEASESGRVLPAKMAIRVWKMSTSNFLIGVGLGNFSPYVQKYVDKNSQLSITVSVFFVYFLVEMGLLGFVLLSLPYLAVIRITYRYHGVHGGAILITILAFLAQYFFAGSYINVVYIWLWLGIGLGLGHVSKKRVKS